MQTNIQPILADLISLPRYHAPRDIGLDASIDLQPPQQPIGDLEPPLELFELLDSPEAIRDDFKFILETDPLSSLFSFDLGRLKPPPPPPPPKPKVSKKKAAKTSKIKAAEPSALDISPGFRAPRTRRALAVAAAFEAEATGGAVEVQDLEAAMKSNKARQGSGVSSVHLGVPQMVEDVDNQGSFKMFDAGWILPSGQKRGGRQPVEKSSPPPPKKRMRTGWWHVILPS